MKIGEIRGKGRKGFFWLLLGTAGQNSLQLISILVLARILTPEEFGVVGIGAAVIAFLRIFAEIGVGPALVQKESISHLDTKTATTLSLVLGIVLAVFLYLQAERLSVFFGMVDLAVVLETLAFMLPVISYSIVGQSLLQRRFDFKKLSLITFLSYLIGYGFVSIYLALNGYGLWSLIAAYWVQSIVFLILLLLVCGDTLKFGFNGSSAKEMLVYGFGHSLARLCNYAAGQGDNLIIGKVLGSESVGLYGRAYQIMSMPAILFGSVIDKVFFPLMARMQDNKDELKRIYLSSIYFSFLVFIYLSGYAFIFSDQIVHALFGSGWSYVSTLIEIMSVGLCFRIGYKFSDCLAMAVGSVYIRAVVQFIYALSVLAFVVFGSQWGLIGAAVGVVLAIALNYLMMMLLAWRVLDFNLLFVFLQHLKVLALFSISFSLFWFFDALVYVELPLLSFLISSCIYMLSFGFVILVFFRCLADEMAVVRLVLNKNW